MLLVGRVAAGHTCSDDSWQGSTMSSLHFGTSHSQNSEEMSLKEEASQSFMLDRDLEAQREEMDGHKHTGSGDRECTGPPSNVILHDCLETEPESLGDHHGRAVACTD